MRKFAFILVSVCTLFLLSSCVENSQKYKSLLAAKDSLDMAYATQATEMESVFADINEISAGMQSIREAEHMIAMESSGENKAVGKSKQQLAALKGDIKAVSDAINNYKEQLARLEGRNKKQSAEFKKMIAGLNEELDLRSQKIAEITKQLADRDQQIGVKNQQIVELNQNVDKLNQESTGQKEVIAKQDESLHMANYLIGTRKELKDAQVISRQGLFCPPIVSSQAQKADFKGLDIRQMKSIPLNSKKAKVLSVHPADSYTLEKDENEMMILKITDENAFWKQTKYLVVMIG